MKSNKNVGRFMVAVGAVIEHKATGKILLLKRSQQLDWQPGEWEIIYGRMNQFETPVEALRRELKEEIGLEVEVGEVLRVWHIFRGERNVAANELVGITYRCQANNDQIRLSTEHWQYQWVKLGEALNLVKIEGIRQDIMAAKRKKVRN